MEKDNINANYSKGKLTLTFTKEQRKILKHIWLWTSCTDADVNSDIHRCDKCPLSIFNKVTCQQIMAALCRMKEEDI